MVELNNDWDLLLKDEFSKQYYLDLRKKLIVEYKTQQIFPDMYDIFNALRYTPYSKVKAVIIGQDPYHNIGQAHGLSFSVRKGVAPPPSLINIFKEIKSDIGTDNLGRHGELIGWAENGVLLLNSVLTVRANQPRSHRNIGWEIFTDNVIKLLNQRETPIVFLLWGNPARRKAEIITNPIHKKLMTVHPSPLSAYRGFFGCKHFSKTNEFLNSHGIESIDWSIK